MQPTILVVDDSLPMHKLVKALLEVDALSVHSAYDGDAALTAAATLAPALILLDIDIPGLDGFEVCRRLKASPVTATIPVVFLSADAVLSDKVSGLEAGASDFITKPFKPDEFRARVRAALRTRRQMDSSAMVDGFTGLWNRTYLDAHLPAQLSLAQRSARPLACTICEVDGLDGLTKRFGELVGNSVLRTVGRVLLSGSRPEDIVCRLEQERFILLAPSANRGDAAQMADRLRQEIETQLRTVNGMTLAATCSFGVADTVIASGDALIERATAALLWGKQSGRNNVFVAQLSGEEPQEILAAA